MTRQRLGEEGDVGDDVGGHLQESRRGGTRAERGLERVYVKAERVDPGSVLGVLGAGKAKGVVSDGSRQYDRIERERFNRT